MKISPRAGSRPRTTDTNPHSQIDQQPDQPYSDEILARMAAGQEVVFAESARAPVGTVGMYINAKERPGPEEAYLLGLEFAHIHPGPDHSLHLTLPDGVREDAIEAGWAEPHPLAGQPTVSPHIVLLYAPRDAQEADVVLSLVEASKQYAMGT